MYAANRRHFNNISILIFHSKDILKDYFHSYHDSIDNK